MNKAKIFKQVTALILTSACALAVFAGCKKKNKPEEETPPPPADIVFVAEQKNFDIYDSGELLIDTNLTGAITWASSNEQVATVSNGVVTTYGLTGEAYITATQDGQTATCKVVVADAGNAPVLKLSDRQIALNVGGELAVNARVLYRGKDVTDSASIVYYSESDAIAKVNKGSDNGYFVSARKAGETVVHVSASLYGKRVGGSIAVNVYNTQYFFYSAAGLNYTVDSVNELDQPTVITPSVSVYGDSGEISNATLTYESLTPEILNVNPISGQITALKAGEGRVKVAYTDEQAKSEYCYINVTVNRKVKTVPTALNVEMGRDDVNAILDFDPVGTIYAIEYEGKTIPVSASGRNIVLSDTGVITPSDDTQDVSIKVHTSMFVYQMTANVVTRCIRTVEDLKMVGYTQALYTAKQAIEGYYTLGCDIDGKEATGTNDKYRMPDNFVTAWGAAPGFTGVFNGKGYTVSNIILGCAGLFGGTGPGAVIKNFNLVHIDVAPNAAVWDSLGYVGILGGQINTAAEIGNINIQIDSYGFYKNKDDHSGLLCGDILGCRNLHDVTIDASALDSVECLFGTRVQTVKCTNVKVKAKSIVSYAWTGESSATAITTCPEGVTVEIVS